MSKLIFPEHGGMYVDDDARVVKTIRHKDRDGAYTVKIVAFPDPISPRHKRYQWHYLAPGGGVAGTSGYRSTVSESLASAISFDQGGHPPAPPGLAEARKIALPESPGSPQEASKILHGEQREQGRCLRHGLAKAEQYAEEQGWTVEWDYDQDEYQLGDAEDKMPDEVLVAVLKDADGHVLESLGGIGDPSPSYQRLVEAELALEAMPSALLPAKTY